MFCTVVKRHAIKPEFIQSMLTCGEFYPENDDRSVRNREYRVAKSPVPLLAIRYLSPHDELFLRLQPELYTIFLQQVKGRDED